ncbi:MAG: hypothetical protein JWR44_3365 [Hymenobacter sp.]|jgi:hypothetical protein|nr:hypothetical protein [Hymenobacter sp.]
MTTRFLCLLLAAGSLGSGRAHAQEAARLPRRDSAYAVHKLFRQQRQRAISGIGFGGAGLAGMAFNGVHGEIGMLGFTALVALLPAAIGVRQLKRYSEGRENLIVQEYEHGWPMPADVRKRLRRKHFHASR